MTTAPRARPGNRLIDRLLGGGLGLVIHHAATLLAGLVGQRFGTLIIAVLLGRYLLPDGFGKYLFIFSLLEIAVLGIGLSSQTIVVRDVARAAGARETYADALWLRLLLAAPVYALLLLGMALFGPAALLLPAAAMGVGMVAGAVAEVPAAVLLGRREMTAKAILDGAVSAIGVALFWAALALGQGLTGAAWAYAGRGLVNLSGAWLVCRLRTGPWPCHLQWRRVRDLALQSLPLFGDSLAVTIYTRVAPIFLVILISDTAAGLFGGAFRIFEVVTLVGTVAARAAFPSISGAMTAGAAASRDLVRRLTTLVFLCALAPALAVSALAGTILEALLGQSFGAAAPVLRILLAAAPLIYVYDMTIHYLYALHRQRDVLFVNLGGIGVSLTLNLLIIPPLGLGGAAAAVLLTEISLFTAYLILAHRHGIGLPTGTLILGFASVLGLALTGGDLAWLPLWIGCGALAATAGVKSLSQAVVVTDRG